jgi:hypothetical protein
MPGVVGVVELVGECWTRAEDKKYDPSFRSPSNPRQKMPVRRPI